MRKEIYSGFLYAEVINTQGCTEKKCGSGKGHKPASRGLWRLAIKKIRGFSAAQRAKTAGFFHKTQLARRLVYFATVAFFFCEAHTFVFMRT